MAACASTQYWGRYHTRYPSFVSVGLMTWNNGFLDCFASPGGSVIAWRVLYREHFIGVAAKPASPIQLVLVYFKTHVWSQMSCPMSLS